MNIEPNNLPIVDEETREMLSLKLEILEVRKEAYGK